ncbi:MAG TPA: DUF5615 family PIN-like protein [Polyangia bacterium]
MKLVADESVEQALVDVLRGAGHDVLAIADACPGAQDEVVLELASDDDRIVVTNDKDFGELVFRSGSAAAGVLLVRVGTERTAAKIGALQRLLRTPLEDLRDHFTVLGATRIRRRPLRR